MRMETKRLILRSFTIEDLNDLYQILGDKETMKYSEEPYTMAMTKSFLTDFCIAKGNAIAAYHKDDKKVIGYILFKPLENKVYEMGWFFNRHYWGHGYAYEACSKVIDYGFTTLQLSKIVAETIDDERSVPFMRKLGMTFTDKKQITDTKNEQNTIDLYVYSIKKEDLMSSFQNTQ